MKNFSVNVKGKEYWISRSIACACFIFKEKNNNLYVLIEKRGKGAADFQNHWCCVCGYLDYDETCEECCKREAFEECGIKIGTNKLHFMKVNSSPSENHQNVTLHYVYFADKNEDFHKDKAVGGEKDEIADVKWFNIGKISGNGDELSVDIYKMMELDWCFDHERRIIEHLSQFFNLNYKDEKEKQTSKPN